MRQWQHTGRFTWDGVESTLPSGIACAEARSEQVHVLAVRPVRGVVRRHSRGADWNGERDDDSPDQSQILSFSRVSRAASFHCGGTARWGGTPSGIEKDIQC